MNSEHAGKTPDYATAIQEEQAFWDHFHADATRYGIPHWLDLRKATLLRRPVYNPFDDPHIERILRGTEKEKFLQLASAVGPGARALDFGCGMGWLSLELARAGLHVTGIDLSPRSVEIARKYAETQKPPGRLNYYAADLNLEDLGHEQYDLIVVWDVLHHLPTVDRVIYRLIRALKPQGRLVIWDHIGMEEKNLRFYRWFHYFVPADLRMYLNKLRRWFGRPAIDVFRGDPVPRSAEPSVEASRVIPDAPFEHHSESEILPALQVALPGAHLETHLSFALHLAHYHRLPRFGQYAILWFLKRLDDWLIQMGILRGEYILCYWEKPASSGSEHQRE